MGGVMMMTPESLWERCQKWSSHYPTLGLALDLSRMNFPDDYFDSMAPRMQKALTAMKGLEQGDIARKGSTHSLVRFVIALRKVKGSSPEF